MQHLPAMFAARPWDGLWPGPDLTFPGKWEDRNWRNVPGPIYGAMTDGCWFGRLYAPRHVLYGDDVHDEQEFLYRQPRNVHELRDVIVSAQADPYVGWGCDGDTHRTPSLVRDWWRDRDRSRDWITVGERALRDLVADLNTIDSEYGLIDTIYREQAWDAFQDLAGRLHIPEARASEWFDEDRRF
ncbi:hypothetical protein GCM10007977_100030 [Dactylosporangium sucinum]|uniref:Uncharacterized protein n=2 Tax=Dactylosporangium sucinum TaxID=1424081 RepID=A0A917UCV7_9ACTN|nr:hypothetical protein GCM10007977_100030 [Dactylosporangium sucinum]